MVNQSKIINRECNNAKNRSGMSAKIGGAVSNQPQQWILLLLPGNIMKTITTLKMSACKSTHTPAY